MQRERDRKSWELRKTSSHWAIEKAILRYCKARSWAHFRSEFAAGVLGVCTEGELETAWFLWSSYRIGTGLGSLQERLWPGGPCWGCDSQCDQCSLWMEQTAKEKKGTTKIKLNYIKINISYLFSYIHRLLFCFLCRIYLFINRIRNMALHVLFKILIIQFRFGTTWRWEIFVWTNLLRVRFSSFKISAQSHNIIT